jgi:phosphatidylserine/phosphatidylglycerophosphate/cardiolipin synthase-like enzyme
MEERNISYSGDETYKEIDKLIKEKTRSELLIVCPYINEYYARMLIWASGRRQVRIITSNSVVSSDAVKLIRKSRPGAGYIKAAIYFIILEVIFFFLKLYYLELLLIPVVVILLVIAVKRAAMLKNRIAVKVSDTKFIHEKLYISDSSAILGSANLTYSGTRKNIEHIEVTFDAERISALKQHFNSLWSTI